MSGNREEIGKLVALQLGRRDVAPEQRILEDLGAESIDLVNIIANVEERYHIRIAEVELPDIRTVQDLSDLVDERVDGSEAAAEASDRDDSRAR